MRSRPLLAFAAASTFLMASHVGFAQTSASIPIELQSAHSLFLSFAGDDEFVDIAQGKQLPGDVHNRLYTALTKWGQLQLQPSPASADLILEVHASLTGSEHTPTPFQARRLEYKLYDRATHVVLWGGTIHVEEAARLRGLDTKLDAAITFLIADLDRLHSASPHKQP